MTKRGDGNFEAAIPAQADLSVVMYYVNATDNGSHESMFPSEPNRYFVGYGVPTILYATGHGEYVGGFDNFADVARDRGFYFQEEDINNVNLDWVEFIIISDPESQYTTAELAMIDDYVRNGGGLLVLSETDYLEYGRPENCNPILEYLGIEGRFNDDGFQDEYYCWNYPTYGGGYGDADYSEYSVHIPYFNYLHRGVNGSYVAGDYEDWGSFDNDTTGITSGFVANKQWVKASSASSLYNTSNDIVVIRGSGFAFNKDNDVGGDGVNEAYFYSYPIGGATRPPALAANDSIGSGRVLYGGLGRTLGDGNYYGWKDSNLTELSQNIIDWLVNVKLDSGPSVNNVTEPENILPSQKVTIEADVIPSNTTTTITDVILHYSVNGSYYTQVAMTGIGGNTYAADIPGQSPMAVVKYYVEARDSGNNFGFWPTIPEQSGIGWYVVQGGQVDNIVISEVCYDPPGTDGDYEFLELYNPFPTALDLTGWVVEAQNGNGNWTDTSSPLPAGSEIPAYGFYLIAKSEYQGWGADFITVIVMQNGPSSDPWGDSVRIYDENLNVVDRVCWDDDSPVIPGLNESMYEGWPALDQGSGSIERLPAFNDPFAGNWQDTDNNSADFIYRKFVDAQGTTSPPEYPPWAANVTSPFPLPDDHPSKLASAPRTAQLTRSSDGAATEMPTGDRGGPRPLPEPSILKAAPMENEDGTILAAGGPTPVLLLAMTIPALVLAVRRRWK